MLLARQRHRGAVVRLTRPASVRHADGSTSRAGAAPVGPDGTVLRARVRVELRSLTIERREHIFGTSAKATETIRVPIDWALDQNDQVEVLTGPETGTRYRVESVIAYRGRPRIQHAECALVALPAGAK